jgi:hypothetical protein
MYDTAMPGKVLMKAQARGPFGTRRQDLTITDESIDVERVERGKPVKTSVRHERINTVRVKKTLMGATLEISGMTGTGTLLIPGLEKAAAEKAKALIDTQMRATLRTGAGGVAGRLASWQMEGEKSVEELKARIAMVEQEFQGSRKELQAAVDALAKDLREFKVMMAATTIYVSAQDHGGGIRGCVDVAEQILAEIHRRDHSPR